MSTALVVAAVVVIVLAVIAVAHRMFGSRVLVSHMEQEGLLAELADDDQPDP